MRYDGRRTDWWAVITLIVVVVFCLAFWSLVGWGISLAFGTTEPRHTCVYSKPEMHKTWGISAARCVQP